MNRRNKIRLKYVFLIVVFITNVFVFYDLNEGNTLSGSISVVLGILLLSSFESMKAYFLIAGLYNVAVCYVFSKLLKTENSVLRTTIIVLLIVAVTYPFLFLAKTSN